MICICQLINILAMPPPGGQVRDFAHPGKRCRRDSIQKCPYSLFFYLEALVKDDSTRRWVCVTQPTRRPPTSFLKTVTHQPATGIKRRWITYYRKTAHYGQREPAFLGKWIVLGQKEFHLSSINRESPSKQWLPWSITVWRMTTTQRPSWSDSQQPAHLTKRVNKT